MSDLKKEFIKERNNSIRDMFSRGRTELEIASILRLPRNIVSLVLMDNIANEHEISLCIEWLNLQKKIKTVNRQHTSYHLKHVIEKWAGDYISNDSLVVAANRLDLYYEPVDWSGRFIYLPLSNKTVKLYSDHFCYKNGFPTRIEPIKRKTDHTCDEDLRGYCSVCNLKKL